jgi:hypothetical protein
LRCFLRALDNERKISVLRNLAMVRRQQAQPALVESLALAKEALAKDVTDGRSWFVLGNTHLALFFAEQSVRLTARSVVDDVLTNSHRSCRRARSNWLSRHTPARVPIHGRVRHKRRCLPA